MGGGGVHTERGQQLTHQLTCINSGSEERRECCLEEHQQVSIEWKSDGDLFWQCKVNPSVIIYSHIYACTNTAKWRASPDSNG